MSNAREQIRLNPVNQFQIIVIDRKSDVVINTKRGSGIHHWCQRRRTRSCWARDSNTGTGDNETPDNVEEPEHPVEPTSEQDEREEGQYSPEHIDHEDSEDINAIGGCPIDEFAYDIVGVVAVAQKVLAT